MATLKYNTIEIDGVLFDDGFSIYLMELMDGSNTFYYVGMTGDNYYPSARSAFHRLGGHFDRAAQSTQNQLGAHIGKRDSYEGLKLRMHHFPIGGYSAIEGASNKKGDENYFGGPKYRNKYTDYKSAQTEVAKLEKHIIYLLKKHFDGTEPFPVVNKTKGERWGDLPDYYRGIVDEVFSIIE